MIRIWWLAIILLLGMAVPLPAVAQSGPSPTLPAQAPAKVQELMRLLDDPAVRDWVAAQHSGSQVPASADPAANPASSMVMNPGGFLEIRLEAIRTHLIDLAKAVPLLPAALADVRARLMVQLQDRGPWRILLLIGVFLGLGWLVERLFRRLTSGIQHWIVGITLETVGDRLRAAAIRLCFAIGLVAAFAIGSVGAFLLFDWPPLLREIVLGYLLAILILRIVLAFGRFTLSPGAERFRLAPINTTAAWHWYWRIGLATGWLAVGWVTVAALFRLGMPDAGRQFIAYALGIILLAIGIEAVWRRPAAALAASGVVTEHADHRRLVSILLIGYFTLLWLLWVASAMPLFWILVVTVGLPYGIKGVHRAVNHVLRPAGAMIAGTHRTVTEVCLDRGLRALLIIGSAFLLARACDADLIAMTRQDTLAIRLVRGAVTAVAIALVAEFLWHFLRAAIDAKLAGDFKDSLGDEESRRQARLRTLLPILRNIMLVVIIVIAGLMILSSMGIEIGPLIAGAGVVGVAIGVGAQTLVKDVISGMFYLLDDAFRIGEYIQSGNYKGTVESFSLRSVRLRHQRGPIYTVPFGELGAVQNMSRDWVIDKLTIGVDYNTDLEKAGKLIKRVGKELAADPEFSPHIIEPLKMQGVEQFGDYAIQIRMKMTTKPGEQFVIRRRALAAIRQIFNEHGIEFARPTVQVANNADGTGSAAARHVLGQDGAGVKGS
jgi:small-conductance mechanosensitive channel